MNTKIFIFGHYGEKNTGDDAMIYALLQELNEIFPLAKFSIMSPRRLFIPTHTIDKVKFIKPSFFPVFREIMSSSIFIMGGGTQIYDYGKKTERLKVLTQMLIITLWAKIFCSKIYFFNIGVEPFETNIRKFLSKRICKLADLISLRDQYSYSILKNMGIKKIKLSFDLAVLLDPHSLELNNSSSEDKFIGMSILPFYEIYHSSPSLDNKLINEFSTTLNEFLAVNSDYKLYLFIFKGKSRSDDYDITQALKRKIDKKNNITIINYDSNPFKMLSYVKNCDIFIGMRYHSCLFAYITKKPLLIINYFQKCSALAVEIGLPEKTVISLKDILDGGFNERLKDIINNPDEYMPSLPINKAKKRAKITNVYREVQ
ncbi:polysaccharide pyruvyl transferase family protein [Methanobacterium formicicum]|nr:polysaccharide pyruvyl transferase family protein [Methanobacterium formicicum]